MSYFSRFPSMIYDMSNSGNYKLLPDILRRVKARTAVKEGRYLFDSYDVKNGEKPEDIAYKWFGDAQLHWIILMTNNVTDRFHQWPMSQPQFQEFLEDKYDNPDGIHHYEITQSSGSTSKLDYSHLVEVNSDASGASAVSNREYEQRLQDNKRLIKILRPEYLSEFVEEFKRIIQR